MKTKTCTYDSIQASTLSSCFIAVTENTDPSPFLLSSHFFLSLHHSLPTITCFVFTPFLVFFNETCPYVLKASRFQMEANRL